MFVNHKKFFTNSFSRVFTFDETRIVIYQETDGTIYRKLNKCTGSVQNYYIFSERDLYMVLTSGNFLFIWNFQKNVLLMKIPLMNAEVFGTKDTFFTCFCVFEFEKKDRGLKGSQVYSYNLSSTKKKTPYAEEIADGDLVFCSEKGGGLLVGKITYPNEKGDIQWQPVKLLGMIREAAEAGNKEMSKTIKNSSNNISVIYYQKIFDTLYMVDQTACVRIFKNMIKNIFKPTKAD